MPLNRRCRICQAPFVTYPSLDQKYCSRACFHISKRKSVIKTRYRVLHVAKDHPLVRGTSSETVHEHRAILFEKIGPGSHPCYHCGKTVTWMIGAGPVVGALVTDHLDRDPKNNDPDNLVPSCQGCNNLNCDRIVQDDEDYRVIAKGTRVRGERRACEQCSISFVSWPSGKQDRGRGRFCSRSCARRSPRRKAAAQGSG